MIAVYRAVLSSACVACAVILFVSLICFRLGAVNVAEECVLGVNVETKAFQVQSGAPYVTYSGSGLFARPGTSRLAATLFGLCVPMGLLVLLVGMWAYWVRSDRMSQGRCQWCGYRIGDEVRCTECGRRAGSRGISEL